MQIYARLVKENVAEKTKIKITDFVERMTAGGFEYDINQYMVVFRFPDGRRYNLYIDENSRGALCRVVENLKYGDKTKLMLED